jgi:hypothetical protein
MHLIFMMMIRLSSIAIVPKPCSFGAYTAKTTVEMAISPTLGRVEENGKRETGN